MSKFIVDDETFELIDDDSLTWPEVIAIEGVIGGDIRAGSKTQKTAAYLWASMKRQRPQLTWTQFGSFPISGFEFEDEVEAPKDETPQEPPVTDTSDPSDTSLA